jgi:hypothetical protein
MEVRVEVFMFLNGTLITVFAALISLAAGFMACNLGLGVGWVVALDWSGFYAPLLVLEAFRLQPAARRGFL